MVWRKSSAGRITARAVSFCEASTPSGRAIAAAASTISSTWLRLSIAGAHMPSSPISSRPPAASVARRHPPTAKAIAAAATITAGQGAPASMLRAGLSRLSVIQSLSGPVPSCVSPTWYRLSRAQATALSAGPRSPSRRSAGNAPRPGTTRLRPSSSRSSRAALTRRGCFSRRPCHAPGRCGARAVAGAPARGPRAGTGGAERSKAARASLSRSRIIASTTMARPASRARPTWSRWSDTSTSRPRPPAPIIAAITTMPRAIIIVWFTPAMIVGIARGRRTPRSSCQGVAPKAVAASIAGGLAWRSPRLVSRTTGGSA